MEKPDALKERPAERPADALVVLLSLGKTPKRSHFVAFCPPFSSPSLKSTFGAYGRTHGDCGLHEPRKQRRKSKRGTRVPPTPEEQFISDLKLPHGSPPQYPTTSQVNSGEHSRGKLAGFFVGMATHIQVTEQGETESRNRCHSNCGPCLSVLTSWFSNLDIWGTLM